MQVVASDDVVGNGEAARVGECRMDEYHLALVDVEMVNRLCGRLTESVRYFRGYSVHLKIPAVPLCIEIGRF